VELPKPGPITTVAMSVDPDLESLLAGSVLHFDTDASNLDKHDRQRLQHVADYLLGHPGTAIRVAGNCDERGTEEYNLALGQRRSDVAKQYLVDLGVEEARVVTVSYGKEHPASDGHDEASWAQNRRDELFEAETDVVATSDDR
jgi:peptidoglycan-associated lipoprotein